MEILPVAAHLPLYSVHHRNSNVYSVRKGSATSDDVVCATCGNSSLYHKAVPPHAMEAPKGRGGVAPTNSRPRY
jgi:hypothetical protein